MGRLTPRRGLTAQRLAGARRGKHADGRNVRRGVVVPYYYYYYCYYFYYYYYYRVRGAGADMDRLCVHSAKSK